MTNREAYVEKLRAQLDEWSAELEQLRARARGKKADLKLRYDEQVDELGEKIQAARNHLQKLKEIGGDNWESLKAGADAAWDELKDAFRTVFSASKGSA